MIVQYLLDADEDVVIPGVEAPQTSSRRGRACRARAGSGAARDRADRRAGALAREEGDLVGEQFLHWFLQEQREEVASMSALLAWSSARPGQLLLAEDYLRGTQSADAAAPPATPPAAGGAL